MNEESAPVPDYGDGSGETIASLLPDYPLPGRPPREVCNAPPKSEGKLKAMEERAARGECLFHEDDAKLPDREGGRPRIVCIDEQGDMEVETLGRLLQVHNGLKKIKDRKRFNVVSRERRPCELNRTEADRIKDRIRKAAARAKRAKRKAKAPVLSKLEQQGA